jgi:hypothetical protein
MRDAVRAAFRTYQAMLEGIMPCLYLDIDGAVTTAIGCLVDSPQAVSRLEFVHLDMETPATPAEIAVEWAHVKSLQSLREKGGEIFLSVTTLRLTPASIETLLLERAAVDEEVLRKRFEAYDAWPADAQMGVLSNAWAAGAAWVAPKFDAAARALDFAACAGPAGDANVNPACRGEAWLRDSVPVPVDAQHPNGEKLTNPGLRPRNLAAKVCFENAAASIGDTAAFPPETLYWPRAVALTTV